MRDLADEMMQLSDGSFLLQNLYSRIILQANGEVKENASPMQYPLEASEGQHWEFVGAGNGSHYIRLKGT